MAQSNTCAGATPIVTGVPYSGTTVGATTDGANGCGSSNAAPDVWYRYTPSPAEVGQQIVFSLCGSSYDTVLSIHSGCPGTAANALACNDDSCGLSSQITYTVAQTTYLVRVAGFNGQSGAFVLSATPAGTPPPPPPPPPPPSRGPDVWVRECIDMQNYTYTTGTNPPGPINGVYAFAVGTDACNLGDYPADWISGGTHHPVIAQNMYRLRDGRFEQIGQSWLKHGFAATNSGGCGTCQNPGSSSRLGPNCSDAYGSGLNGGQGSLGPRSTVNAATGVFAPNTAIASPDRSTKRLQVPIDELSTASLNGARIFVDTHYVTADDAQWNNGLNNSTYREVSVASLFGQIQAFVGNGSQRQDGIWAWKNNDSLNVNLVNAEVDIPNPVTITPPSGSVLPGAIRTRFEVASKATSLGGGMWHYEYAVYNLNNDQSAGTFSVALPAGTAVSNVGFHAPISHSGEPYSNAPWTSTVANNRITWACEGFDTNVNANALRWGTLYNFRFDCNVAPNAGGIATLGLFKPGPYSQISITGIHTPTLPSVCLADIVSVGGLPPSDGTATGDDFNAFIAAFAANDLLADIVGIGGLPPGDGQVTGDDFNAFIASFANGCP